MRRAILLFDLDGTLTDPREGIVNSILYALKAFGIREERPETLVSFIGPPLGESFALRYGFGEADAKKAVATYREYFSERGIFENRVYDGIEALLHAQRRRGARLALATSKPEVFALRILRHFGLEGYFSAVAGSELDGTRVRKSEVIRRALALLGGPDPASALMVGDRKHDVIGAKETGLDSVGVLYGYGSRAELRDAGATFLAADVPALRRLLDEPA